MRSPIVSRLFVLLATLFGCAFAGASEEARLLESINSYRAEVQRCSGQPSEMLPPLSADPRLVLSVGIGDLEQALGRSGYPLANVRAINLSGPRNAQAAMAVLEQSFCKLLLDAQFIDVGISRLDREWRIVLGRPLLTARLGDWQSEGKRLLETVNQARSQTRRCGSEEYPAAPALAWNAELGSASESHSRAMANGSFFSHQDADGRVPGDRAELAGYQGSRIGENLAAALDTPRRVVDAWLASPGHCANLMSSQFTEFGAAYAEDPKSDAAIYWTAMFGTP
jgi:uncharacterized protein YkwD